jgi:hypothetical protein
LSRSVHTSPRTILAQERVRAPFAYRRVAGVARRYRLLREAKERGITTSGTPSREHGGLNVRGIRITATRAPRGWYYPADRADVARLLRFFGPEISYGLRSVDLIPPHDAPNQLQLGALVVPGQIKLFAQQPSPWMIGGMISIHERERLSRAGAIIEVVGEGLQTIVNWPGDALREFVLFDVLMHEVGHHIVQQYTAKRYGRVMRTKDHEAFADRFARRCRQEYARS